MQRPLRGLYTSPTEKGNISLKTIKSHFSLKWEKQSFNVNKETVGERLSSTGSCFHLGLVLTRSMVSAGLWWVKDVTGPTLQHFFENLTWWVLLVLVQFLQQGSAAFYQTLRKDLVQVEVQPSARDQTWAERKPNREVFMPLITSINQSINNSLWSETAVRWLHMRRTRSPFNQ